MATPPPKKSLSSQVHHINHLKAQREHLLVLQEYLMWMSQTNDSKIDSKYQDLAKLLEQAANHYASLINMLQRQVDGK